MRRRAPLVVAGAVAGAAVAAAIVLLQEPAYRAEASIVLARQGQPPGTGPALADAAAAAAELFESRTVAGTVAANLRLDDSPEALLDRLDVRAQEETSLVHVEMDAPSRDEARRVAQAVIEVATVLYNDRFGPETTASVWEAPSVEKAPVWGSAAVSLGVGALAGSLAALLAEALGRRLARRRRGGWSIAELERVAAEVPATDDRRLYLEALRDYADDEGALDPAFDGLVEEVFGEALAAHSR